MKGLNGTTGLLYHRTTLTSGSTCSTGRPGLLTKTSGSIKEVSGVANGKMFTCRTANVVQVPGSVLGLDLEQSLMQKKCS